MSPVKSKGKINGKVQKAEAAKKGDQLKSTRQDGSKISQSPCKVRNGKQKCKDASPTLEKKSNVVKKGRRNKADQSTNRSADPKGPQKPVGNKLDKRAPAHVRRKKDVEVTKGASKTARPDASKDSTSTVSTRAKNKSDSDVTESEEESESNAGSSAEVTDEELSGDEKEEEQGSSEETVETQRSEESSEEETEPSDTEQTGNSDSDKELSEQSKSDSEVKSVSSSEEEEEEDNEGEAEVSEAVISDGGEDKEISQEDICARPAADKTGRRQRQTPRPPQPAQTSKFKMFRKTKADKQAEKAEKQKAKAEKQRLEKEAKQKAKEEKKNKKKPQKPGSSTEDKHPPKGISTSKTETAKGKIKQSNSRKNFNENDAPADADATDPDDEEDEDGPTLTKAIKGQSRIMLLKTKGKDFKPFLETEKQEDAGSAAKGRQQSLLLGKVKMASLRNRANKILAKPGEEAIEGGTPDGESSKVRERLIARRKGMTTLRRVSGWIHKKVPRGLNLKKKLSAWTRAIGVSRWLSFRAIKQKQAPKKSKGNILKSRMAMRVASKTSMVRKNSGISSENKVSKEKACLLGKAGEGGEGVPAAEKDGEAKYAVVLPRMNKLGKAKTTEAVQEAHGPSTSSTGSPEEPTASEPKPPKLGARLVLPVKPDLSLLKSIKNPLSGGLTSGRDVTEGSPQSSRTMEASPNTDDRNRRTEGENQDGVGFLPSARPKLDPSHINLTKISLSGGTIGPNRTKGQDPEREAALGIPRSATQPFSDGKAATGISGVRSLYEEEADREVAQLMGEGDIYGIGQPEVHWTGNPWMSGDPQVCVIFFFCQSIITISMKWHSVTLWFVDRTSVVTLSLKH